MTIIVIEDGGDVKMIQVGVAELKARLSEYLARVADGEEIVVTDRGRPVARLVPPIWQSADEEQARLLDLQRRGLIQVGTGALPDAIWNIDRPNDPLASVRATLEAERSAGY